LDLFAPKSADRAAYVRILAAIHGAAQATQAASAEIV